MTWHHAQNLATGTVHLINGERHWPKTLCGREASGYTKVDSFDRADLCGLCTGMEAYRRLVGTPQ